jgi:hypothetical protein
MEDIKPIYMCCHITVLHASQKGMEITLLLATYNFWIFSGNLSLIYNLEHEMALYSELQSKLI